MTKKINDKVSYHLEDNNQVITFCYPSSKLTKAVTTLQDDYEIEFYPVLTTREEIKKVLDDIKTTNIRDDIWFNSADPIYKKD